MRALLLAAAVLTAGCANDLTGDDAVRVPSMPPPSPATPGDADAPPAGESPPLAGATPLPRVDLNVTVEPAPGGARVVATLTNGLPDAIQWQQDGCAGRMRARLRDPAGTATTLGPVGECRAGAARIEPGGVARAAWDFDGTIGGDGLARAAPPGRYGVVVEVSWFRETGSSLALSQSTRWAAFAWAGGVASPDPDGVRLTLERIAAFRYEARLENEGPHAVAVDAACPMAIRLRDATGRLYVVMPDPCQPSGPDGFAAGEERSLAFDWNATRFDAESRAWAKVPAGRYEMVALAVVWPFAGDAWPAEAREDVAAAEVGG